MNIDLTGFGEPEDDYAPAPQPPRSPLYHDATLHDCAHGPIHRASEQHFKRDQLITRIQEQTRERFSQFMANTPAQNRTLTPDRKTALNELKRAQHHADLTLARP